MSNSSNLPPQSRSSGPLIVAAITWGVLTLLFFLLFSIPSAGAGPPTWFLTGTNILETGAFFVAALLCFRNWQSRHIVSGRRVWLWIGAGLLMYGLGNVLFFLWGVVWGLKPVVSLGDFFYILSYLCLAIGMLQAALPRRLNLEPSQWLMIAAIGLGGVLLTLFVYLRATAVSANPEVSSLTGLVMGQGQDPALTLGVSNAALSPPPVWINQLDQWLQPLGDLVSILYLIGDTVLLIIAGTLLVAFWGGRFSQSWTLIAIAAFCLYIADMFFAYAVNTNTYVEGRLWEVFWPWSAIFFWLGAVVERAVSINSRRNSRHRRG